MPCRVCSSSARFIKPVPARWMTPRPGPRIKDIAANYKTLLDDEDDDLVEGANDEAEGDPEMAKALIEMRKLVAQVSGLRA